MRPLLSNGKSLELDAEALDSAVEPDGLIERAARGMAERLARLLDRCAADARPRPLRVVALVGRGSNGADALATLRILKEAGRPESMTAVLAFSCGSGTGGPAVSQLTRLEGLDIETLEYHSESVRCSAAIRAAGVVVEGLAGTGAAGNLKEPARTLVGLANSSAALRVAVDLPAGLASDAERFAAGVTLMVAPFKELAFRPSRRAACGTILPVDNVFGPGAGAAAELRLAEAADLPLLVPRLAPDDHKGRRGRVGIWAGAVGTTGAASLACAGSVAAGCGLARLRVRGEIWQALAARLEDGLVAPLASCDEERDFAAGMHALLAGPGWGVDEGSADLLDALLCSERPLVLDADALVLLERAAREIRREAPLVLTPHPGELARLGDVSVDAVLEDPRSVASSVAVRFGAVVCVRAVTTWVLRPDGTALVVDGLEPSLAVAGSGDVFAGLLAGLLARASAGDPERFEPAALAAAAALAHASAGRSLARRRGFYGASELAAEAARIIHGASTAESSIHGWRPKP
ncbi:MAG: NAD(P)H-hydrate dehydratase [Spirochaetales bacterium]|nr:NAD(P)H-hydrate dehydratase [Spirochaetales bacterium]